MNSLYDIIHIEKSTDVMVYWCFVELKHAFTFQACALEVDERSQPC